MSEPKQLRDLMADWLDTIDPQAEIRYRQQLCREAYARGQAEAYGRGYTDACADLKAVQQDLVSTLRDMGETLAKRWHLCCPPCRRGGHRFKCPDCQDRTQATFSRPMSNDYQGGAVKPW